MNDSEQDAVSARLHQYRSRDMKQVQGWFASESAEVISTLLTHQVATGVRGDLAEIGVHHGKSFLLLANGVRSGERAVALDVFGLQEKNVDNSGLGDRAAFEANLAKYAATATVEILEMSSLDVTADRAQDVFGSLRLMSIDGGHTADITAHDLTLAQASVAPDGVVVLDDLLNAHWLGVISGLFLYLDSDATLIPFAYSDNKLYLAPSAEVARDYAELLRRSHPDLLGKQDVELHGGTIDVYGQGSPRRRSAAADSATSSDATRRQVDTLKAELRRSTKRVAAMEASHSWRLTAPLRAVSTRIGNRAK